MDQRTLSGISVCVMYALLIATCFAFARSGLITDPCTVAFVQALPIYVQLVIANAIGLAPAQAWLFDGVHWGVHYMIVASASFYALYWVGRWIAWIDEE